MPGFTRFSTIALLLAALPLPARAQGTAPSRPQWVLDQSGYYCALAAKLAGPPDATLVLRNLPGTGTYDLTLVADRWPPKVTGARKQLGFALLPGTAAESRSPEMALLDRDRMISLHGLGPALFEGFPKSTALEVRADGKPVVRYALPPNAADAAQAFYGCIAGKLIDAGADPAGFQPGASQPKPIGDREKWLDLPPLMSMADREGLHAAILLDLDSAGKPTDCVVLELVGRLDRQRVCQNLLQRARYEPARNPKGKPVNSIAVYDLDEIVRVTVTVETFAG